MKTTDKTTNEYYEIPENGKEFKRILLQSVKKQKNKVFIEIDKENINSIEKYLENNDIDYKEYKDYTQLFSNNLMSKAINKNKITLDEIVEDDSTVLISPVTFMDNLTDYATNYFEDIISIDDIVIDYFNDIVTESYYDKPTIKPFNAYIEHKELLENLDAVDNDAFVEGLVSGLKY